MQTALVVYEKEECTSVPARHAIAIVPPAVLKRSVDEIKAWVVAQGSAMHVLWIERASSDNAAIEFARNKARQLKQSNYVTTDALRLVHTEPLSLCLQAA